MYILSPMRTVRLVFLPVAVMLVALLTVVFVAEAKKGHAKAAPTSTADCKTDADCVAVSDDCCPCSQGGKQHAIPKKDRAAYEKDLKKRCTDTACTEVMSEDPTCTQKPFCAAGICELGG
jgi:hypothetical protein